MKKENQRWLSFSNLFALLFLVLLVFGIFAVAKYVFTPKETIVKLSEQDKKEIINSIGNDSQKVFSPEISSAERPSNASFFPSVNPQKSLVSCCSCSICNGERNLKINGFCYRSVYVLQENDTDFNTLTTFKEKWLEQGNTDLIKKCVWCGKDGGIWCAK